MKYTKPLFISILIVIFTATQIAYAQPSIPAGYQSFYVLGNSTIIVEEAVDEAFGVSTDLAVPISIFSVVSSQDKTRIYVDQKNNGYTFNPSNFTGADAVFELDRGGVITFNNTKAPYYVIVPTGSGQLLSGGLTAPGIDGGDYFFVAGGPLSVFRGVTDGRASFGDGNYVAGMWELFSVEEGGPDAQKVYEVPCGEDTPDTLDFDGPPEGNGGTFVVVQSTANGTIVNYSQKGVNGTQSLDRGDSFVIPHVNQGDFVTATNKIQVGLIASGGQTYAIRYFTLKDARFTGRNYWIPVYPEGSSPIDVKFHIHAITDANVTILTSKGVVSGWNNKPLAQGTTDATYVTNGTYPVRILAESGQMLTVLVSVDTGFGNRDWGYVPIDSTALSSEYFIPYAPSGRTANSDMQLYVISLFGGTTIYADYDQDGLVDTQVTLDQYESFGFFDDDLDNTGTHLFSDFPFTVVYGQASTANIAGLTTAGYDWGYTVIPLGLEQPNVVLELEKTVFPPAVITGMNVTFTVNITAGMNDFDIQFNSVNDTLPTGFVYLPGTTTIIHEDSTITYEDPIVNGNILTWGFNEVLQTGDFITMTFMANSSMIADDDYINIAVAEGEDPFGNVYTPEGKAFITVSEQCIACGYIYNVTCGGIVGVPNIKVELYNCTDPGSPVFINETLTDINGFYIFCEYQPGTYCIKYDYLDPDMGFLVPHSDDDPLLPLNAPWTSSANFTVGTSEMYCHNFEVILPVDLYIDKTGETSAQVGETVQYFFEVGNNGFTGAKNVTVTDDVCGTPDYILGDTNLDDRLDPSEVWIYSCDYTVKPSDLDPLVNIVNVTTISHELDPSDNNDTWSLRIIKTDLLVEKTRITPVNETTYTNMPVVFNVTIRNKGNTALETIPLKDTYDPLKLDYISSNPAPDTVNEGTGVLEWFDLTGLGTLAPNVSSTVIITFEAVESTVPGSTTNLGETINAKVLGENIFLSGSDTAFVVIQESMLDINKTCISHPGGSVVEGKNVTFRITITNNGDIPLLELPLLDTYDPVHLTYLNATPVPDAVNDTLGTLEWADLTNGSPVYTSESVQVEVQFKAKRWTSGDTENIAIVEDALFEDQQRFSGNDTAELRIIARVGGTVYTNPLYRHVPLACTLALLIGLAILGMWGV